MLALILACEKGSNADGENGICGSLAALVFVTRCGLNLAFCFIFVIHTELFPTFFLATSYGLCSFVGRGITLAAPILAESENRMVPLYFLMAICFIGMIGCLLIK